jgi:hypothetical protein
MKIHRLPALLVLMVVLSAAVMVSAQDGDIAPLATLDAGDFRALSVSSDGARLFVTDGSNQQVRVYDIQDKSNPNPIASVTVDGTPIAVGAVADYALVAVELDGSDDILQVVAPDRYSDGGYGVVAFFDLPGEARAITISPNEQWALVMGERWYSVLQLVSATENSNFPVQNRFSALDGVLSSQLAFLSFDDAPGIVRLVLARNAAPRARNTLTLPAIASSVSLNARNTIGAAVAGESIIFFDAATMDELGEAALFGGIIDAQFVSRDGGDWLAVIAEDRPEITLVDARSTGENATTASIPLPSYPRAMVTWDRFVIVTDGTQVSIYASS